MAVSGGCWLRAALTALPLLVSSSPKSVSLIPFPAPFFPSLIIAPLPPRFLTQPFHLSVPTLTCPPFLSPLFDLCPLFSGPCSVGSPLSAGWSTLLAAPLGPTLLQGWCRPARLFLWGCVVSGSGAEKGLGSGPPSRLMAAGVCAPFSECCDQACVSLATVNGG